MALGGKRPGAGRKKGKKSKKTLQREAVLAAFRERAMAAAGVLFEAQLTLARGQTFLYKIEKEWVDTGKGKGFYRKKKPVIVTEQWELEAFLENEIVNGDASNDQDGGTTYYFLTTKEPNNMAIDSILDRTFGRPAQSVDLTSQGKPLLIGLSDE